MNKKDNIADMIRRSELYASSESEKEKKTEHYKRHLKDSERLVGISRRKRGHFVKKENRFEKGSC